MNQFEMALAARAFREGQGIRGAQFRHRRLLNNPIAIVLWQHGGEPFSAAALGYGCRLADLHLIVAGDPRNRDLSFSALARFAQWFNPRFEAATGGLRTESALGELARVPSAPQVLVANEASVQVLGQLGRRLAYLPTDGLHPAAPELIRMGQHFLFLHRYARTPGQQLIVALTDLLAEHWITPLSPMERLSLAALNAYLDPPPGTHGFVAAAEAENITVGPIPTGEDDKKLEPLVAEFNRRRGGRTDGESVGPILKAIEDYYRPLVQMTWALIWQSRDREASWPEAQAVSRRWEEDVKAYTLHIDWSARGGRRRTRQSARQAAITLKHLEGAKALLKAEEACDDPMKMIPYLMENKAVQGQVVRIERDHREVAKVALVRRPLVTIISPDPCLIPRGTQLWWSGCPGGRPYEVHEVLAGPYYGSTVKLKLTTGAPSTPLPAVTTLACFSIHTTQEPWCPDLPLDEPWSHRPVEEPASPPAIEDEGEQTP